MEERIRISLGFLSLVCVMAWINLRMCLYFLSALFLHELGHIIAMLVCHVHIKSISLKICGAVIHGTFWGYKQELVCAVCGPAASFGTAMIFCRWIPEFSIVNLLLCFVNLLPLYPLDGGRALRAGLLLCMGEMEARRILSMVMFGVCCLLMLGVCWAVVVWQAGIWPIFAALIILCRVGNAKWEEQ